jgi:hypothetical protein
MPRYDSICFGNLKGAMGRLGKKSQQYPLGQFYGQVAAKILFFWVSFRGKGTCWVVIYLYIRSENWQRTGTMPERTANMAKDLS